MTEQKPKEYLRGSVREIVFNDGGSLINISVNIPQLQQLCDNEKGWVDIVIAKRRETDQYGNTHYAYKKPPFEKKENRPNNEQAKQVEAGTPMESTPSSNELPF